MSLSVLIHRTRVRIRWSGQSGTGMVERRSTLPHVFCSVKARNDRQTTKSILHSNIILIFKLRNNNKLIGVMVILFKFPDFHMREAAWITYRVTGSNIK